MVKRLISHMCEQCKKTHNTKKSAEQCELSHQPSTHGKEKLEKEAIAKLDKDCLKFDLSLLLCFKHKDKNTQLHPDNIYESQMYYFADGSNYLMLCRYTKSGIVSLAKHHCRTCEHCLSFSVYERWVECDYKQEYEYYI